MGRNLTPVKNQKESDLVMTPKSLAKTILDYLPLHGKVLEPCRGTGSFYNQYDYYDYCEITEGKDFFAYDEKVDWIVSNPPWSIYREFAQHSYKIADNIAYLITINHDLALKARLRDMEAAGFGIKEIILVDAPKTNWPQMGFQLGICWKQRGYSGDTKWTRLDWKNELKLL